MSLEYEMTNYEATREFLSYQVAWEKIFKRFWLNLRRIRAEDRF